MVAPSLVAFLPPLLLILVAAISPEPTVAAHSHSKPKPFPPLTPLRMQALLRHERGSSSRGGKLVVTAAADGTSSTAAIPFTAHYFPQELDHFTFTPNASMLFYQKYLVNDTFWRRPSGGKGAATGPMFVYTGNEGDIEWFATNTGFVFDIAPKFGALLVFIEDDPTSCPMFKSEAEYRSMLERGLGAECEHSRPYRSQDMEWFRQDVIQLKQCVLEMKQEIRDIGKRAFVVDKSCVLVACAACFLGVILGMMCSRN
ncbi:hypothetical protein PAHAL_4G067000 [Panicum hallii]|uniref:Uncharacterized protein n=1 Tax=Panicum hallii TaxID=206008 RepID=A0A2T8JC24_9POAL|nr:hypothetical protein PAHAL_4G067000 [Panicum hallii]